MSATEPITTTEKAQKAPKADVQTLAYLLKEIENRMLEERKSRKQFALSMIVFGVLFIGFGGLKAVSSGLEHEQRSGLAAMRREPLPPQPSPTSLPVAIGFSMIAYGFSKQW